MKTCPFNCFSEESAKVSDLGYLPTNEDVRRMYHEEKKVWMCQSNEDRVCQGLRENLKEDFNEELKTNGKQIQTYTSWYRGDESY